MTKHTENIKNWPWHAEVAPLSPNSIVSKWPRITIVTPSYNQGEFLEETIRSVLLQNYPNLEYIVIDGGSTDNSVEVIKKYAHRLTYWESTPDRGQSHAINKGFARASGDIMGWINSDDGLLPGALHTVASRLMADDELLVGACTVAAGFVDTHNAAYSLKTPTFERMIYRGNTLWQPGVFWPRRLWDLAGPLSESLHYTMDYDLFMRMMPYVRQMVLVDQPLALARSQPAQKTRPENLHAINLEKEWCSLRAARRRGDNALYWLGKAWLMRIKGRMIAAGKNPIRRLQYVWPSKYLLLALFDYWREQWRKKGAPLPKQ